MAPLTALEMVVSVLFLQGKKTEKPFLKVPMLNVQVMFMVKAEPELIVPQWVILYYQKLVFNNPSCLSR